MRTRIEFEHNGYDIAAQAIVLYGNYLHRLNLYFKNLEEQEYPRGIELEEIRDLASELILEEYYTNELY